MKSKKVLAAGTFDILHPGHYEYLRYAKSLGDELVVVIARDKTVEKIKGRKPIIPEEQRRFMVEALKPVDRAILGSINNMFEPIIKEKPDIIVLGPDQETFKEEELKQKLKNFGLDVEVVRFKNYIRCPFHSSYDIVKEILRRFNKCYQEKKQ
ncbi:adenylyltransferase/cytidyltransferase family protein [Methanocaldococcus indicus]|uniref:adenylyltransferase/cytidyltransferase family protein n=1 Tax=Methanocaldococcus indicus TaxID=213231 RepID=UPI003C6D291F